METDVKATQMKITYSTMSAEQMVDLHAALDKAIADVKKQFGQTHPMFIHGQPVTAAKTFADESPIDTRWVLGHFQSGGREHFKEAVAAARSAAPAWAALPWRERVAKVRAVADAIRNHRWELSAIMGYEAGKNRLECVGDVEESADLMSYYCDQVEAHNGFEQSMATLGPDERNSSVLRPYGVWAVISPFNFPMALAGGPSSGALVAGNTVVFKPANQGALLGWKLYEIYRDAGIPPGAFHYLPGRGSVVGDAIVHHADVDGITFTGSYEVGMGIYRSFASDFPKPVICEMGGKNPTIVTKNADLDKATDGVMRSAFGFGGQKCSANSRVYVEREVYDDFVAQLKDKTENIKVGNPLERDVYLGPLINDAAVQTFEEAAQEAKKNGNVITGGERLTEGEYARGTFVQPTVVEVPDDSWIWKTELFVPFVSVA